MSGIFQVNRFNRRILFYHLFTVFIVLTATLFAAYSLLHVSKVQQSEKYIENKLELNSAEILSGINSDNPIDIERLNTLLRIPDISLICVANKALAPQTLKSWPQSQSANCQQFEQDNARVSANWITPDNTFEITIYGQHKPYFSAMTITLIWFLVVFLSLAYASYLIIELADSKFTQPLQRLQKSLTRFTLKPSAEYAGHGPSSSIKKVSQQVNQLIQTTRQQELDLLESKDKFAALYSALQESEEYYKALFEQANEAIMLLQKPNFRFSHFNQTAHQLLGYGRHQFANLTTRDIFVSIVHEPQIDICADTIPSSFIANMITSSGEDRICRVNTADIRIQQNNYRMLMFHDITKQRASQRELLTLNSRLQTVLDTSQNIAIIAVDQYGQIEIFNKGAENILQYHREQMIGKRQLFDVIKNSKAPSDNASPESIFKETVRLIESDSPLTTTSIYIDSNNQEVPVEQTLTRIIDNEGNHHGYLCIAIDLRERIAEQQQQKELESQLHHSQKMETIGTLAGGIAHDLNNLLTPVMGYTEMMLEDTKENEKHQRRLQRILNATLRAKELVKQILTFSHHVDHYSEPALIKSIVKEVIELLFASLPPNIQLSVDIKDPNARIFADVTKIHQVLMNLCTNAAHAIGDKEGTITIEIDTIEYDENIGTLVLPSGKYALLVVRDTGCGISQSAKQRIFEPFFTTKGVGEGTGLGLSVVHGIVHSHNGTIRVNSKQNNGSEFYVYLPSYDELEDYKPQNVVTSLGSGLRILLIDDDEPVLQLSEELLKRKGYYVESYSDSSKALQAFRLVPDAYDVIITDQSMPKLSGTDLAREIRLFNDSIPIILLTGLGNILSDEEQQELGISKVVAKPILSNDLIKIIYEVTNPQEAV